MPTWRRRRADRSGDITFAGIAAQLQSPSPTIGHGAFVDRGEVGSYVERHYDDLSRDLRGTGATVTGQRHSARRTAGIQSRAVLSEDEVGALWRLLDGGAMRLGPPSRTGTHPTLSNHSRNAFDLPSGALPIPQRSKLLPSFENSQR